MHDAEQGALQRRRQPVELHLVDEFDLGAVVPLVLGDKIFDGRHDSRFVQHRRPQSADQPAGLGHRLAQQPHALVARLLGGFEIAVAQPVDRLELVQRPVNCCARPS